MLPSSIPAPPKEIRFPAGPLFDYYLYPTIDEAEQRSGDIGFPIFSTAWLEDGSILVAGGGGGSVGYGVRSAIVAGRLVNGTAVDSFFPQRALVDPQALALGQSVAPRQPMVQAVGEVNTGTLAVLGLTHRQVPNVQTLSSLSEQDDIHRDLDTSNNYHNNNNIISPISSHLSNTGPLSTMVSACMGPATVLFSVTGFGSLTASSLPPCRDLAREPSENRAYYQYVQQTTLDNSFAAQRLTKPTLPLSTPFKSPLLSQSVTNAFLSSGIDGSYSANVPGQTAARNLASAGLMATPSPYGGAHHLSSLISDNGSLLTNIITRFAQDGKRKMTTTIRFRSDFSHGESYTEASCIVNTGNVVITGGNDGVLRAWLIRGDSQLLSTFVTHGVVIDQDAVDKANMRASNSNSSPNDQNTENNDDGFKSMGVPRTPANRTFPLSGPGEGQRNVALAPPTPHSDQDTIGWVSPLCLPIGSFPNALFSLDLSPDCSSVLAVDTRGQAALWRVPSAADIASSGFRIPVDYLSPQGTVVWYPKQKNGPKRAPQIPSVQDQQQVSQHHATHSRHIAFIGVHDCEPIVSFCAPRGVTFIRGLFWSLPVPQLSSISTSGSTPQIDNTRPQPRSAATTSLSTTATTTASLSQQQLPAPPRFGHLSPFYAQPSAPALPTVLPPLAAYNLTAAINSTTELNFEQLQEYSDLLFEDDTLAVPTRKELERYITAIARHPTRLDAHKTLHFIFLAKTASKTTQLLYYTYAAASSPHPQQQQQQPPPRGSRQVPSGNAIGSVLPVLKNQITVFPDATGSSLAISPNGQFIAVAGRAISIYTSPDVPILRTAQLLATGHSASLRLSRLGPLELVNYRDKFFSVPSSGIVFDPSSHIVLAVGSRAIAFLHVVARYSQTSFTKKYFACSKWCFPLYYAMCCLPWCCPAQPPLEDPYAVHIPHSTSRCLGLFSRSRSRPNRTYSSNQSDLTDSEVSSNACSHCSLTVVNIICVILVALFASQFIKEVGR